MDSSNTITTFRRRAWRSAKAFRTAFLAAWMLWAASSPPSSGAAVQQPPGPANEPSQSSEKPLRPVPDPDLEGLDPAVAEQIRAAREVLLQVLQTPGVSAADMAENFGLLGQVFQAYEFNEAARDCYLNAVDLAPRTFRWLHYLAGLSLAAGELESAADFYSRALAVEPDNLAALVGLGNVNLQRNELDEARGRFLRAMQLDRNCAAAAFGLGQVALSRREYPDAVGLFHKTLALVPAANAVHYPLALAYRGLGQIEEAKRHLELQGQVGVTVADPLMEELQNLKQGEVVFLLRGRAAFQAGRFQDAAALFLRAVSSAPRSARARVNAAAALAETGDLEGAEKQLREALNLKPDNFTAVFNLGRLLRLRGDWKEALPQLDKAVDLGPRDPAAHVERGRALLLKGDQEEARSEFELVVQRQPDYEEARLELASFLVAEKKYEEARKLLEEANQTYPKDGLTAHALARLLAGCPDASLRNGEKALDLALRVFEARNSVGNAQSVALAYAELGRCDEAAQWQEAALAAVERTQGQTADWIAELKAGLSRYQQGPPCRPPFVEPATEANPKQR